LNSSGGVSEWFLGVRKKRVSRLTRCRRNHSHTDRKGFAHKNLASKKGEKFEKRGKKIREREHSYQKLDHPKTV